MLQPLFVSCYLSPFIGTFLALVELYMYLLGETQKTGVRSWLMMKSLGMS